MNAAALLAHYERIADAPDATERLRRFVWDLAVRGKLVEQDSVEGPASALLTQVSSVTKRNSAADPRAAPFDVPASWHWSTIGQITTKTGSGSTPRGGKEVYKAHGVPFLRSQNIHNDGLRLADVVFIGGDTHEKMSGTAVKSGDLLLNITGGSIGRCCLLAQKQIQANISQHVAIIRPAIDGMGGYLHIVILSPYFQSFVQSEQTGAGRGGLPKNRMDQIFVPVPPLAEQHRIVAKVDELMALCDRLEAARLQREATRDRLTAASLARLNTPDPETFQADARFAIGTALPALTTRPEQIRQLRQAILNLAVHGKLVSQDVCDEHASKLLRNLLADRERQWERTRKSKAATYVPPEHEDGQFTLPASWTWASALELCQSVESGSTPPAAEMHDGAGEIPFIKVYNLTKNGSLDFSVKPTFISRSTHEGRLSRSRIRPGDVLMNIVGPPLGKVSLVPDTYAEWNTNQAVVAFRPLEAILSRYLSVCLLSESVLSWIIDLAQQTVGQVNISVTKSRRLPIPLPPLAEQHRIVAKVDELMSVCDQLEASLTHGDNTRSRLLGALLHEALAPAARELEAA